MTSPKTRIAIFLSGRGSNMQALANAASAAEFPAEVVLVFSNDPQAPGLRWAESAGYDALAISHRGYSAREAFDRAVDRELQERRVDLVCLAGFMRLLSPWFVDRWSGRMINVHPSLLPAFRGLDTHGRALEAGVKIHGCTVHFVVPEVDAGPIIAQAAVPVLGDDTPDRLAARVLAQEHLIYPRALEGVASGRISLCDGRVVGETSCFAPGPSLRPSGES